MITLKLAPKQHRESLAGLATIYQAPANEKTVRYKDKWVEKAQEKIAEAYKVRPAIKVPMVRNRLINRAYAEMYLSDPVAFKWAGIAALASQSIGDKLSLLRDGSFLHTPTDGLSAAISFGLWFAAASCDYIYLQAGEGNKAIYEDIYWQHLAYREGGIAELERICEQGDLPQNILEAWQMIDRGKRSGEEELIWQGNGILFEYEQKQVIQPILYDGKINKPLWKAISVANKVLGVLVTSPVPAEGPDFREHVPDGNLAEYSDRWKWCIEGIFPVWKDFETNHREELRTLLTSL